MLDYGQAAGNKSDYVGYDIQCSTENRVQSVVFIYNDPLYLFIIVVSRDTMTGMWKLLADGHV